MAIDDRTKRTNALSLCTPLAWTAHPDDDGTIDAGDRGHLLHMYGPLAEPPADVVVGAQSSNVPVLLNMSSEWRLKR